MNAPTQEQPGFFSRMGSAAKGFATHAAASLPVTAMYSAASLGISAAMGSTIEWDPFNALNSTPGELGARMLGVMTIGSAIHGVVGAYEGFTGAGNKTTATQTTAPQRSPQPSLDLSKHIAMSGFTPPPTPTTTRGTGYVKS